MRRTRRSGSCTSPAPSRRRSVFRLDRLDGGADRNLAALRRQPRRGQRRAPGCCAPRSRRTARRPRRSPRSCRRARRNRAGPRRSRSRPLASRPAIAVRSSRLSCPDSKISAGRKRRSVASAPASTARSWPSTSILTRSSRVSPASATIASSRRSATRDPAVGRNARQPGMGRVDLERTVAVAIRQGDPHHRRLAQIVDAQGRRQGIGDDRVGLDRQYAPGRRRRPWPAARPIRRDWRQHRSRSRRPAQRPAPAGRRPAIEQDPLALAVERGRDKGEFARAGQHIAARPQPRRNRPAAPPCAGGRTAARVGHESGRAASTGSAVRRGPERAATSRPSARFVAAEGRG